MMDQEISEMSMAEKNFQEWYKEALEAAESSRSYVALRFILQWEQMMPLAPSTLSREALEKLREKLLFIAFPDISLSLAQETLQEHLINFLASEADIDYALKTRFLFVGYGNENADRQVLREAVLRNKEKIGNKSVSEWLQAFDKMFSPSDNKQENAVTSFFTQYPGLTELNKNERAFLKRLLQVYDEWLRSPLIPIFDNVVIYQKLVELEKAGVKEFNPNTFERDYLGARSSESTIPPGITRSSSQSESQVSLPLLPALSKYNQLAQQSITREKIRLRTQVEPVRPTLMNWLKYYRSELGIGYHDSVKRGEFLYRSENGSRLSDEERERLSLILKSIEEEFPLQIDANRSEIVFPSFQKVPSRAGGWQRPKPPSSQTLQFTPQESRRAQPASVWPEPASARRRPAFVEQEHGKSAEMPVTKPSSFRPSDLPSAYRQSEPVKEWEVPKTEKKPEKTAPSSSPIAFKEMPVIQGMKPAPAFAELRHGKPAFQEQPGKPAWKISSQSSQPASPESMTFTSPHVFPAEREHTENLQRRENFGEQPAKTPLRGPAYEKKFIPPQPRTPVPAAPAPPLAPKRKPELLPASSGLQRGERPRFQSPPNRFNITPMSYREENERNN